MSVDEAVGIRFGRVLEGKRAIVTGAGQGLGRDIAIALTQAGAQVAVIDLNPDTAEAVAAELATYGLPGVGIAADVSQRDEVDASVAQAVAELGGIDILVNNAQNLRVVQTPFVETDEEHVRRHLDSGFFGTYYYLQACYEHLKKGPGAVINIGSAGGVMGLADHFSYAATKEAIRAATRVVAREWGHDGIRVNTICPAAYDTPSMKIFLAKADEATLAYMKGQIPMGRFGGGYEVASVAVCLASEAFSYVTGHTIMVDGGSSMDAGR